MKNFIHAFLLLTALALAGCETDETRAVIPDLSATAIETGTESFKFSVEGNPTEAGAYICQLATEKAPTPATILKDGQALSLQGGKQEVTINNLLPEKDYVVYIAVRNVTEVKTKTLAFTTGKTYAYYVELKEGWIQYYGDFYKNNVGYYMLAFTDGPISKSGLPTRVNDHALRLFIGDVLSNDSRNAKLTPGTYHLSDGHEVGTADAFNCNFVIATEVKDGVASNGYEYKIVDGDVKVDRTKDDVYTFDADLKIEDNGVEKNIKCHFSGKLPFTCLDPAVYNPLEKDVNVVPTNMSGNYSKDKAGQYGTYNLTFYNTPTDQGGFISGAGDLLNLTLLTPYSPSMDISKLAGTYDKVVTSAPGITLQPFTIIAGLYGEVFGMYVPQGTYYTRISDALEYESIGLVSGGKITITTKGTDITVKADLTTPQGKHITIDYTGPTSGIADYSQYAKPGVLGVRKNNILRKVMPRKSINNSFFNK